MPKQTVDNQPRRMCWNDCRGACHSTSIMQGLDQEMPGSLFLSTQTLNRSVFGWTEAMPPPINQTLHFPPTVTMARIDEAVTRVLVPMFRMGLFERPFLPLNSTANNVTSAEHNGGEKTVSFCPFLYKNDHFTKTGSGQT